MSSHDMLGLATASATAAAGVPPLGASANSGRGGSGGGGGGGAGAGGSAMAVTSGDGQTPMATAQGGGSGLAAPAVAGGLGGGTPAPGDRGGGSGSGSGGSSGGGGDGDGGARSAAVEDKELAAAVARLAAVAGTVRDDPTTFREMDVAFARHASAVGVAALDRALAANPLGHSPLVHLALLAARLEREPVASPPTAAATALLRLYDMAVAGIPPSLAQAVPIRYAAAARAAARVGAPPGAPPRTPLRLVRALTAAAAAAAPTPDHLTPIHADLLGVALAAGAPDAVRELALARPSHMNAAATALAATDVQLYYYYCGCVAAAVGRLDAAAAALTLCLTVPADVPTDVALAAHKKRILLGLLASGVAPPLPAAASATGPMLSVAAEAYEKVAAAFVAAVAVDTPDALADIVAPHARIFAADGNAGLVAALSPALLRRRVMRLTRTYLTLPLADVASMVGLPDAAAAEALLRSMVADGEVAAVIDGAAGMASLAAAAKATEAGGSVGGGGGMGGTGGGGAPVLGLALRVDGADEADERSLRQLRWAAALLDELHVDPQFVSSEAVCDETGVPGGANALTEVGTNPDE
ncbi:hypothetical protein MMPV_002941 [Pyropia vietnamensis]